MKLSIYLFFVQEEIVELEEFELLEEAADNTSFSSNASVVVNMMARHNAKKQVRDKRMESFDFHPDYKMTSI